MPKEPQTPKPSCPVSSSRPCSINSCYAQSPTAPWCLPPVPQSATQYPKLTGLQAPVGHANSCTCRDPCRNRMFRRTATPRVTKPAQRAADKDPSIMPTLPRGRRLKVAAGPNASETTQVPSLPQSLAVAQCPRKNRYPLHNKHRQNRKLSYHQSTIHDASCSCGSQCSAVLRQRRVLRPSTLVCGLVQVGDC